MLTDLLSHRLFWDVDKNSLEQNKNKRFIIQRVLEYGILEDWNVVYKHYGLDAITEEVKQMRCLEDKALNFIATLSNTPLSEFRCYILKQSAPKHWIS